MDILNLVFTGNLTEDAKFKTFDDTGKTVVNFTVATNPTRESAVFFRCDYWINKTGAVEPEGNDEKSPYIDILKESLKKGTEVMVQSQYLKEESYEGKDGGTNRYFVVNVSKLKF